MKLGELLNTVFFYHNTRIQEVRNDYVCKVYASMTSPKDIAKFYQQASEFEEREIDAVLYLGEPEGVVIYLKREK